MKKFHGMKLKPLNQELHKYFNQTQTIGNTMSETKSDVPTLTVDGNHYPINTLPGDIQELISAYQGWETELNTQKLGVFKTEAAMRAVSAEIQSRIRQMAANAAEAMEAAKSAANELANDATESGEAT